MWYGGNWKMLNNLQDIATVDLGFIISDNYDQNRLIQIMFLWFLE